MLAEVLKRSSAGALSPPREKRYSDYQERASASCTGLCMYYESRSYAECFDMCNWNDWDSLDPVYTPGLSDKNRRHLKTHSLDGVQSIDQSASSEPSRSTKGKLKGSKSKSSKSKGSKSKGSKSKGTSSSDLRGLYRTQVVGRQKVNNKECTCKDK